MRIVIMAAIGALLAGPALAQQQGGTTPANPQGLDRQGGVNGQAGATTGSGSMGGATPGAQAPIRGTDGSSQSGSVGSSLPSGSTGNPGSTGSAGLPPAAGAQNRGTMLPSMAPR